MSENGCNILIVGVTGVGKSSLLNYILGESLQGTGVGKPVTQKGIHKHTQTINNRKVSIYDTWGLEMDKYKEWMKYLEKHLKEHGIDKELAEWMHTAIYCINGASSRVQEGDEEIIKLLLKDGLKVLVAITKSDAVSKKDGDDMKKVLTKEFGDKIAVKFACSIDENTEYMTGEKVTIKGFGKDEIIDNIINSYLDSIIVKLPKRIIWLGQKKIESEKEKEKYKNGISENEFNELQNTFYNSFLPTMMGSECQKATAIFENIVWTISPQTFAKTKKETKEYYGAFKNMVNWLWHFVTLRLDEHSNYETKDTGLLDLKTFDAWKEEIPKREDEIRNKIKEAYGRKIEDRQT